MPAHSRSISNIRSICYRPLLQGGSGEDDHGPAHDVTPGQLRLVVDVIQRHGREGVLDQLLTRKREHFGKVVVVSQNEPKYDFSPFVNGSSGRTTC